MSNPIKTLDTFEARINLLTQFTSVEHRLPRRPASAVPDAEGYLGRVVNRFRDAYRLGALPEKCVTAIEAVPEWRWAAPARSTDSVTVFGMPAPVSSKFQARLDTVLAFVAERGRMPAKSNDELAERRAAEWCRTQRAKRTDERNPLTPAEKDAVERVDGWFWEAESLGTMWRIQYDAYVDVVRDTGKAPSSRSPDADIVSLYRWGKSQKAKRMNVMLPPHTPAQVKLLEAINGWEWVADRSAAWDAGLAAYTAFRDENGCEPKNSNDDRVEARSYRWAVAQRAEYSTGKLSRLHPERVLELEAVFGWVWQADRDDEWLLTFTEVWSYANENGKLPAMKALDADVRRLGIWCGHIRRARVPGRTFMKLTPGREAALELVPGWYWSDELGFGR